MKVSVNRELTVLTKRVCGIISQGDTSVNTTKTITTTTYTEEGGTKDVYYSLLSTPPFGGGGRGVGFPLFNSPKSRTVLKCDNWSIINAIRYDYNYHEGDINRKTTIMIITQ